VYENVHGNVYENVHGDRQAFTRPYTSTYTFHVHDPAVPPPPR